MRYLFILFIIFISTPSIGQEYIITKKVVPILTEQKFVLNGGVRAQFGGKSRTYFEITLPPNTIEWYYSFTTSSDQRAVKNLQLAAQLTKLLDPTGTAEIAAELILIPSGVAKADVFVLNQQNAGLFIQKADQNGTRIEVLSDISRTNFMHGIVPIKYPTNGTWYLGIRNPSATEPVIVSLEVVAIVAEKTTNAETQNFSKAKLYLETGAGAFDKGDYEKCMDCCKKALDIDPSFVFAKYVLGLCYLMKNDSNYLDTYINAIAETKKSKNAKQIYQQAIKEIRSVFDKIPNSSNANDMVSLIEREVKSL